MVLINTGKHLEENGVDLASLSALHRVLLTTDGTLTETLEAFFLEKVQLVKISEDLISLEDNIPDLVINRGDNIMLRKILLRGRNSNKNYIYAESTIVIERLDQPIQDMLTKTDIPLGQIWIENKLETFKEFIDVRRESANGLAKYFDLNDGDALLSRTYRVISKGRPIIMITEKFPEKALDHELALYG